MDLAPLADRLMALGLMGKAFQDMSRDEVLQLLEAVRYTIPLRPVEHRMPYINRDRAPAELIVPMDAPRELQSWRHPNSFLVAHQLLRDLGAEEDVLQRYLGPDYKLRLVKELTYEAHCPMCGEVHDYRKQLMESGMLIATKAPK